MGWLHAGSSSPTPSTGQPSEARRHLHRPLDAPLTRICVGVTTATGIEQLSQIIIDKITTMPRANVRDHLGRLADADLIRLDRALLVFLGLVVFLGLAE